MNIFNKKILTLLIFTGIGFHTFAQDAQQSIEMADALYQSGKIYVVISALLIIFAGLILYLFLIDKKISRLEKECKKN